MEKSNYALISALYSSGTKGLYSDIYFPIIKYAVVKLFYKSKNSHPYCSAEEVHDFIIDRFGIAIPHIVISKSILKIDAQRWGNIQLKVYEQGETFQIQAASFDDEKENFDEREKNFTVQIAIIEKKYKEFLEREGAIDDGISFIQFISDNTEDILGYFEDQDTTNVDEKYTTMVFFLQYLSDYEKELYKVANQLFWGSIIAGFLRSEKPCVEENENGIKTEYFLDTSIVMGLLNLSTMQRERYSQEVCDIIKSAGGVLRVNPMTVDEISFILQSVEQNGPNPLTDIASAYERWELDAIMLAEIRLNLVQKIEQKGVNVFPPINPVEKQKITQSYQGRRVVRLLGETRSKKPSSFTNDNYRDIHDVYMDDYISERRKKKSDNTHVFFLTANRDLISFCKKMHPDVNNMKSTGKTILELWMHNTKPVDISGCMLTETMARCLDLHNTRVRNKIVEVSHFYNKTKNDFNEKIYKDFIRQLYRRAKHVIQMVEADSDEIIEGEYGKLITEAVTADNLAYDKKQAKAREVNALLSERITSKDEEIRAKSGEVQTLVQDNAKQREEIQNLAEDKKTLSSSLKSIEEELDQIRNEHESEKEARKRAERINHLYKKRDKVKRTIEHIEADILPYEMLKERSFCNWQPTTCFCMSAISVICLVVMWVLYFYIANSMIFFSENKAFITTVLIGLATLFATIGIHYNTKESIDRRENEAKEKWESKEENAKYKILLYDLSEEQQKLKDIEIELREI